MLGTALVDYEAVKRVTKKPWNTKTTLERKSERPQYEDNSRDRNFEAKSNCWDRELKQERERKRATECLFCSSISHLSYNRPENENNIKNNASVHKISGSTNLEESFKPYLSCALINGK